MNRIAALLALIVCTRIVVACGGESATSLNAGSASGIASGTPEPVIADEWRARCASCHRRVEPGTHSRAELDDVFKRHRTRTRLSEDQWEAMRDFLGTPTAAQSTTASTK